jgi:hypothetical protein
MSAFQVLTCSKEHEGMPTGSRVAQECQYVPCVKFFQYVIGPKACKCVPMRAKECKGMPLSVGEF